MKPDESLLNKICLDHPGMLISEHDPRYKKLNKELRRVTSQIKREASEATSKKHFPIDHTDLKFKFEKFPGANAISITNRPERDKTSLAHMIKHKQDYLFCVKSDGTRYLWLVCKDGQQYFAARNMQIFQAKVELPPFFFKKPAQELLIYQSKIDRLNLDPRFTTPKVKIARNGQFESENHTLGRFEGLFRKKAENQLVQAMIDTSDWRLSELLLTKGEDESPSKVQTKMEFRKIYQVDDRRFSSALEEISMLFDEESRRKALEEWLLRKGQSARGQRDSKFRYIFDGELVLNENKEWEFLMFDTILYDEKLVTNQNYVQRLNYCQIFSGKSQFYQGFFKRAKNPHQFIKRRPKQTTVELKQKSQPVKPPPPDKQPESVFGNIEAQKTKKKKQTESVKSAKKKEGPNELPELQKDCDAKSDDSSSISLGELSDDESESGKVTPSAKQRALVTPARKSNLTKRSGAEFTGVSVLEKNILEPPLTLIPIKLKTKDFYDFRSVDFLLENVCETVPFKDNNDGIIITRINYPYFPGKSNGILKWKPDELNSIDFLVIENPKPLKKLKNVSGVLFELFVTSKSSILLFDYMFATVEEAAKIRDTFADLTIYEKSFKGAFLEMVYDKKKFVPLQSGWPASFL